MSLQHRRAALIRWSRETPTRQRGQQMRAGLLARFRREAAEAAEAKGETLSDAELDRRAAAANRAWMVELAGRSAAARSARRSGAA